MAITDTQINDTSVYSPIDGVVLVKSAETGEVLAAGTTVVTIGDIEHPWLRGYINETRFRAREARDERQVTTDSYPGKTYSGRVGFIASEAEFTPKQIQTREERVKLVYRIKIDIDNPQHELKSNMPVDAEIELQPNRLCRTSRSFAPSDLTRRFGGVDGGGRSEPGNSARARSSGWWVRTAPVKPPRCACCVD